MQENNAYKIKNTTKIMFIAAALMVLAAAVVILWKPFMAFLNDPDLFANQIKALGWPGVIVFFFINAVHIFIPFIPAGPFSLAAGLVWGPCVLFWGQLD